MRNITLIIINIIIQVSCVNSDKVVDLRKLSDYLRHDSFLDDTSKIISSDILLKDFDTIPKNFGYRLFDSIINPIPIDSSIFKQTWSWSVDTIKTVLACKTRLRFDPNNKLSDNTYFFIIYFQSQDSLSIAATIYADFNRGTIGTYKFDYNNIKFIELENDEFPIPDLENKMTLNK